MNNSKLKQYTLDEIIVMIINEEITHLNREDGKYLEYLIETEVKSNLVELEELRSDLEETRNDLDEAESENFELRSKVSELQNKILDAAENHI
ncbi:hypothetical protein WCWAEYFT_CDS0018 [Vibrio phage VB_VaC_TDDLMA]